MKNNHELMESQKLKYTPPTVDCFGAEILTEGGINNGDDGAGIFSAS